MADSTIPYFGRGIIFAASRQNGNKQDASVGETGPPCGKCELWREKVHLFAIGRLILMHPGDRDMQRSTISSRTGDGRGAYAK